MVLGRLIIAIKSTKEMSQNLTWTSQNQTGKTRNFTAWNY